MGWICDPRLQVFFRLGTRLHAYIVDSKGPSVFGYIFVLTNDQMVVCSLAVHETKALASGLIGCYYVAI